MLGRNNGKTPKKESVTSAAVDFKDLLEARRETKLVEDTGRLVSVRGSLCLKRRNEIDRDAQ